MKSKSIGPVGVLILIWTIFLAGCSTSSETNDTTITETVFPKDKVIDVSITIDEKDYQDMLDNPLEEEYKAASVRYNNEELTNVGIRTKGNSSLTSVANSESDRYSLKISFDEYISSQNLFGLTTINLNNNFSDPSFMREYLTYELMEEMGLPTPEYAFVNVYINDNLAGLYLAVEQINESFLDRNFETSYGALYKPDGEGSDLLWQGDDINEYTGLNQKSKSSSNDNILEMINELNNGSDYEKYLNVDSVLRYLAVNTATANLDSYQGNFHHNYYLYEEDGVFSMIPWDLNMSFGGFGGSKEDLVAMLIDEPTIGSVSNYPLVEKLLENETYKEKYHDYIKQIVEGYLSPERFETRVDEIAAMIDTYVEQDPTKFYTYEEFKQSFTDDVQRIPGLVSFVQDRVENLKQQLDGTLPSYVNGEGVKGSFGGPAGMQNVRNEEQSNLENGEKPDFGDGEQPNFENREKPDFGDGEHSNFENKERPDFGDEEQSNSENKERSNFGDGEQTNPGEGGRPDFNGKGPGNRNEMDAQVVENSATEAVTTGIMLVLLIGAIIFVKTYKKRRI